jgi:UDP-glucose 4-epimerase
MKPQNGVSHHGDVPRSVALIPESGIQRVAVVGGSGRLGSVLVRYLTRVGCPAHVFDSRPPEPLPGVGFTLCDLGQRRALARGALAGCDAVVHLGALHGFHLKQVARRRFWAVNVHGTEQILQAALDAGTRRVVLASSTSVYGSGSPPGFPARVLDENTELNPEDVYDLTKIAAERLLSEATTEAAGVALRFGRFFFPSHAGYHMRKLSTGLDVRDACQAVALALTTKAPARQFYCIASDLPLNVADRQRLGFSAPEVLEKAVPGFRELAARHNVPIPERVGKSVDTAVARAELGYLPERALDWLAEVWASRTIRSRMPLRFRGRFHAAPDALSATT